MIRQYCSHRDCPEFAVQETARAGNIKRHATLCRKHQGEEDAREGKRRALHPRTAIYQSAAWRQTSRAVKERDGWRCRFCGWTSESRGVRWKDEERRLLAHHLKGVLNWDPYDQDWIVAALVKCSGALDGGRLSSAVVPRRHV